MGLDVCLRTNLVIAQSSKSYTYIVFLPQGAKIELIFTLQAAVSKIQADFRKLPYLGMNLGKWPKFQNLQIPSFYCRGSKLSLFLLYGQHFSRYRPIFKIAIFGHETWQVAKVPEVAHILSFYLKGSKFWGRKSVIEGFALKKVLFLGLGHCNWVLSPYHVVRNHIASLASVCVWSCAFTLYWTPFYYFCRL